MDQKVLKNLVYKTMTGYFDEDVEPYFNDMDNFLKFLLKHDGFKYVEEIASIYKTQIIKNCSFGFWDGILKLKPEETLKMIADLYFFDVVNKGNDFYYEFNNYKELSNFFLEYDRNIVSDLIENKPVDPGVIEELIEYLSYEEIINELSFQNKIVLGDYILQKLGNEELFLDDFQTVVFKDISYRQKNQDTFILSEKNIMDVIEDPDSLKIIIEKYCPELIDKIYNVAFIACKNVLYSDDFEFLMSALSDIFVGDIFEEGGNLYLKFRNFRKVISNPKIAGGSVDYVLTKIKLFTSFYREYQGGLFLEDTLDLDQIILDEINDIFENHLI